MKLASVRFRPGVQHPEGVRVSREVIASGNVHLTTCDIGGGLTGVALHLVDRDTRRVYGPSAWESFDPAPAEVCTVCLERLPPGVKGETCSRSCAQKLRHRREKK
jgi:hypothetical protein